VWSRDGALPGRARALHAPVWFAKYDHKGNEIVLVVDGNSGGVINTMGLQNQRI
jgi:hypothetical protein